MGATDIETPCRGQTATFCALIAIGSLLAALNIWLVILSGQFSLDYQGQVPIGWAASIWIGASIVAVAGLLIGLKIQGHRTALVSVILLGALALRVPQLFAHPILEIDLYRYIWDGIVINHGVSPYLYSPEQALHPGPAFVDSNHELVSQIARSSPSHWQIVNRVHFEQYTTIYPPVSQFFFAMVTWAIPNHTDVYWHVFGMKAMLVMFDLATLGLVLLLIKRTGLHAGWLLAYAWNPLVVKEIANSGHLDSIAVFFTTASCWALVEFFRAARQQEHVNGKAWLACLASAGCLGLGVGAKLFSVILLPLILFAIFRAHRRQAIVYIFAFGLVACGTMWPMLRDNPEFRAAVVWSKPETEEVRSATKVNLHDGASTSAEAVAQGPPEPSNLPAEIDFFATDGSESSQTPGKPSEANMGANAAESPNTPVPSEPVTDSKEGLTSFLSNWRMNDVFFSLVFENFKPQPGDDREREAIDRPWYLVVPAAQRHKWNDALGGVSNNPPYLAARLVTLAVFAACYLVLLINAAKRNTVAGEVFDRQLLQSLFLVLAIFFMLQPTQNPWYWLWAMPLVCFAQNRGWLWVSVALFVYYFRFWFKGADGTFTVLGGTYSSVGFFDHVLTWLEHASIWLALLLGSIWKLASNRSNR